MAKTAGTAIFQMLDRIGMSGPMWRLSLQALQEKSKYVREAAVELSADLGFQAQREPAASIA